MKQVTLTFGQPQDITLRGQDGIVYRFPFTSIDSDLIGSPEENRLTKSHQLIVEITRSRLAAWKLAGIDLQNELFEIGLRELVEKVKKGSLNTEEKVTINTSTHSAIPPFDPSRIDDPNGAVITIEQEQPRIGF